MFGVYEYCSYIDVRINDNKTNTDMKTTYTSAKSIAQTGNFDKAWEVAKQDEGLLPHVTKEMWITWIKTKI